MSGWMPSPPRARSPAAKSAPRKRVEQGASSAKDSKRASAAGSRSTQISVPAGPIAAAIRRACPPPPKVQSTAVWPGRGASSSVSSAARTGLCSVGMKKRFARSRDAVAGDGARCARAAISLRRSVRGQALGDLRRGGVQLGLLLGPILGVPDLQVLPGPDHDAGTGEAGVLDQRPGHPDATGGGELLVEGAAVEAAAQLARVAPEGAVRREEAVGELLELLGRVHPDAGVEALGENNPIGERRPDPRRDGEAILGVETVLVEAPECHRFGPFVSWPGNELGPR